MKVLKTIVLWLLPFVIPLQGATANAMVICKASQRAAQASVPNHAASEQAHQIHHHDAEAPAGASTDSDETVDSPLAKCGGCAAYCAATAWVNPENYTWPPLAPPSACISYTAFHIPAVVPDQPEHPPRSLLA
jgi:hypothetical protein